MTKTIQVKVTQNHINKSCDWPFRGNCPIENALLDMGFTKPTATRDWISFIEEKSIFGFFKSKQRYITRTPAEPFLWIAKYDTDKKVRPFSFNLRLEKEII